MSIEVITLLLFGALILFLALGLPLAFVLGGVGLVGCYFLWGSKGLFVVAAQTYGAMGKFTLLAIPLFIFMAMILERAGVADDLYTMIHRWMGPVRGGLAMGTVLICAIFAAMSGVSATATVSMGLIALPAMLKRKYDKIMAMGCISGGGGAGDPYSPQRTHDSIRHPNRGIDRRIVRRGCSPRPSPHYHIHPLHRHPLFLPA